MKTLQEIAVLEESRAGAGTAAVAAVSERIAGGWMCYEEPGSWKNGCCGLGMDGPVTRDDVDRLVAFYTSRGVEPMVEVCPFADASLAEHLAGAGFQLRAFENVFVRIVRPGEDHRSLLTRGWPDGVTVTRIDPACEDDLWTFVEVSTSGFRSAEEPMSEDVLAQTRPMVEHPDCDAFVAHLDGRVVGASMMESAPPVAGLFLTSVLPEARRKGIQAVLMVRRLDRARERGCDLVCIHANPGIATENNARRLGFELAYTRAIMVMPGQGLVRAKLG